MYNAQKVDDHDQSSCLRKIMSIHLLPWVSRLIESLVRSYLSGLRLNIAYHQMAQERSREAEALAWADATFRDLGDETPFDSSNSSP